MSVEPADEKTLREKYSVMANLSLLEKLRQPSRSIDNGFDRVTFIDLLETLLGKKNFILHKEVNGKLLLVPRWTDSMAYEYELRKEALRLCREDDHGFQEACGLVWETRNTGYNTGCN